MLEGLEVGFRERVVIGGVRLVELCIGDATSDDASAEDVEDDAEVEVGPLGRSRNLGDVLRPDLVGCFGQQQHLLRFSRQGNVTTSRDRTLLGRTLTATGCCSSFLIITEGVT